MCIYGVQNIKKCGFVKYKCGKNVILSFIKIEKI